MGVINYNHLICKEKIFINLFLFFSKKIIMNTPEYQFLIPAVRDFPDEPSKKQKSNTKKEEPKILSEDEYEEEEEDDNDD